MPVSTTIEGPNAIAEFERLGFRFLEVAQYDLEQLSRDRRVQVRKVKNYAPKERVEQYAVQMAHSRFPHIVVTGDNQPYTVDGNTRLEAAISRGMRYLPAYVLEVEYNGRTTTSKTKRELRALAMTLNGHNGQPLTADETREGVRDLIELGWQATEIARAIGLKPASVTAVKKEIAAAAKLAKVGLSTDGVHGASLRALGSSTALGLNDLPYKALAELASDAGFNASEITDTARSARDKGSDDEQAAMIDGLRTENGDRIRERQLTGSGKPPVSRQMRQHLGFVNKFDGHEQELLETDPACSDLAIKTLETSIKVLTAVLEMQKPSAPVAVKESA